jgi:hypothetical protein
LSTGKLKEFMDKHVVADPYKFEVFKGCWLEQLIALRARNDGEMPQLQVDELYEEFKCPFGCPPPAMDPRIFVDMHPVPRPQQSGGSTKYDTFQESYGQDTPLKLPPLQDGADEELNKAVLVSEKARSVINCNTCNKPRVVYVDGSPGDELVEVLGENAASYTCGADLDLCDTVLSVKKRPFVRIKMNCNTPPESQLWSSATAYPQELKLTTCGWCGLLDGQKAKDEGEATLPLPICAPCFKQHQKSRSSGRANPKFDKGGRRAAAQVAAAGRAADIGDAKATAAAAMAAAVAPPTVVPATALAAVAALPKAAEPKATPEVAEAPGAVATANAAGDGGGGGDGDGDGGGDGDGDGGDGDGGGDGGGDSDSGGGGGGTGGGAEEMEVDEAFQFESNGDRVLAPARSESPERRSLADSFRARNRPTPDEMRGSGDRVATRRLPRAAATNNTAIQAVRARGGPFSTAK